MTEQQKTQQNQLQQKFKSLDDQRLSQIKSLTDKLHNLQKQVQQSNQQKTNQSKKQPVVQGPVRKVSVTDAIPQEIKPVENNTKKLEDQIKLLKSELKSREVRMAP